MSAIIESELFANDPHFPSGELNAQPDGFYTLTINSTTGEVLTVNHDGSFGTAPAGTVDASTRCGLNGNALVFNNGRIRAFPFFPNVPGV